MVLNLLRQLLETKEPTPKYPDTAIAAFIFYLDQWQLRKVKERWCRRSSNKHIWPLSFKLVGSNRDVETKKRTGDSKHSFPQAASDRHKALCVSSDVEIVIDRHLPNSRLTRSRWASSPSRSRPTHFRFHARRRARRRRALRGVSLRSGQPRSRSRSPASLRRTRHRRHLPKRSRLDRLIWGRDSSPFRGPSFCFGSALFREMISTPLMKQKENDNENCAVMLRTVML